jgi:hypothetical protein
MTIMERRGEGRCTSARSLAGARIPGCQRAAASGAAELAIPARPRLSPVHPPGGSPLPCRALSR